MGGECKIKYPSIGKIKLTESSGRDIPFNTEAADIISFETEKGSSYILTF